MTWTLIRKLLRDARWFLLLVGLLLFGFQIVWIKATQRVTTQLAPMVQLAAMRLGDKNTNDLKGQIFQGPGKVMQTVIGGEQLDFQSAQDVLSISYVHPLMQVLFCFWAIGRAAGAIAGEIDRGTMELLLAQPLPRRNLIIANLGADMVLIPILCLALWAGLWAGKGIMGDIEPDEGAMRMFRIVKVDPELLKYDVSKFGWPLINVFGLIFAVSGMTMWLSAAGRSRWRVIGFAAMIMLVQFTMNIIGQIWEEAAFLRPLTLFYYFQPQQIASQGVWSVSLQSLGLSVKMPMMVVLLGVGAIGYAMALRVFERRDLPAPL